jgi:hypothetical protein
VDGDSVTVNRWGCRFELGIPEKKSGEGDFSLHSRQRRAETVVDAASEGERGFLAAVQSQGVRFVVACV